MRKSGSGGTGSPQLLAQMVRGKDNPDVAGGAIVLEARGLNPSKTIAALAERISDLIGA